MLKRILYSFILVSLLYSCNEDIAIDPFYPTTIKALDSVSYAKQLDFLGTTNLFSCNAIDTFGILVIDTKFDSCIDETWRNQMTKEELFVKAKESLISIGSFLNLNDSSQLNVKSINTLTKIGFDSFKESYPDSFPNAWILQGQPQIYEGLEIRSAPLTFLISPNEVVGISGWWYNDIYIPSTDAFSEEDAKFLLMNKELTNNNTNLILDEYTSWKTSKKYIFPLRISDNSIELRVCWALYPSTWEIIIDTQTGKTITYVNINSL